LKSANSKKLKLIAVDEENYKALRLLGHTPESFNDVITKILKLQNENAALASKVSLPGHQGAEPSKPRGGELGAD
jgi:predicted CopG family antitoxin